MGLALPQLAPASQDRVSGTQVIDGSLKFKGGQYLERTSTAGNQTTWTWSGWIKVSDLSGNNIFGEDGGYPNASASFNSSGVLRFTAAAADSSVFLNVIPSAQFRDFSAWYHFVIVYDSSNAVSSERARVYVNGRRLTELSTATYPSQSATTVVNSNGNAFRIGSHSGVDHLQGYMSQCYFIDGLVLGPGYFGFSDPLTNTWKPKKFKAVGTTVNDGRVFSSTGTFSNWDDDGSYPKTELFDGTLYTGGTPNGASSDSSSEATFDFGDQQITGFENLQVNIFLSSNQASAVNVVSVNGVDITPDCHKAGNDEWTTVDLGSKFTSLKSFRIANNNIYVGGFIVDGVVMKNSTTQNLDFGTNGFYLPMDDEDRFRFDHSGKGNDFTEAGWSGTSIDPDVVKDSPSGAVFGGAPTSGITTTSSAPANYATFNPLIVPGGSDSQGSGGSLSDAGLTIKSGGSTGNYHMASCSPSIPLTGKYYFEFTTVSAINTDNNTIGIFNPASPVYASGDYARINPSFSGSFTTTKKRSGTATNLAGSAGDFSGGDVVNIAIDSDNRSIWFGRNGVYYEGNPSLGTGASYTNLTAGAEYVVRSFVYNSGGTQAEGRINFGQKPFKYAPPNGFLPLNTSNTRSQSVITRPDQYVGVATYIGSGNSSQDIIFGFKPDFGWTKSRVTAENHGLFDSVRGLPKFLRSDTNAAEYTLAAGTPVSFISDGINFTNGSGEINESTRGYVAWAWKAGGDKNTFNVDDVGYASASAAGLDGGSINPTGASVGTRQGFSITTITTPSAGAYTVSHGLTKAPDFIIYRIYDQSMSWYVWHQGYGAANKYMLLNSTGAVSSGTYVFNNTLPTASLITDYSSNSLHHNEGRAMIYYSWHDVAGLQKFGTYTGNGSADGPFVELGFRPSIVWIRRTDSGQNWAVHDSERDKSNECDKNLAFNLSSVENNSGDIGTADANEIDFLSTGFKLRDSAAVQNADGGTYIYCAWAEASTSGLFGGGANAR